MSGYNYFEILGVPLEAGNEEIERAFRAKVKQHPPRKDPEGFMLVSEAGKIRDPEFRRDYIESLKIEEIRDYLNKYNHFMIEKQYEAALDIINIALGHQSKLPFLYNIKGHCLTKLGRCQQAVDCYQEAYNMHQATVYLYNMAFACFDNAEYEQAQKHLEKLFESEPCDKKAIVLLSKILNRQELYAESIRILEKGINLNENYCFDDLELLLQLLMTYALSHNNDAVVSVLAKIKTAAWGDESERFHVANKVWELAQALAEHDYFEAVYRLLLFCREVENDPQLEEMIETFKTARYVEAVMDDREVTSPVKLFFVLHFYKLNEAERSVIEGNFEEELKHSLKNEPLILESSIERIKNEYPILYQSVAQQLENVKKRINIGSNFKFGIRWYWIGGGIGILVLLFMGILWWLKMN